MKKFFINHEKTFIYTMTVEKIPLSVCQDHQNWTTYTRDMVSKLGGIFFLTWCTFCVSVLLPIIQTTINAQNDTISTNHKYVSNFIITKDPKLTKVNVSANKHIYFNLHK